jgi:hypothetical protein
MGLWAKFLNLLLRSHVVLYSFVMMLDKKTC